MNWTYWTLAAVFLVILSYPLTFVIGSSVFNKRLTHFILLGVLFFIAFVVRYPNLDRHLSDHHESITAQSMIALQNWDIQGAWKHHLCILQTYPLDADKYVSNLGQTVMSSNGNGYYISFPPFSIILPYFLFRLFSFQFSVINLQLFNMAGHFIATFFLYLTISMVVPGRPEGKFAALIGAGVFIFLAPNLWYFSNTYSWDIFWHYLWVVGIWVVLRIYRDIDQGKQITIPLYILSVVTFFMVYSEYQGLLFALSVVLCSYWYLKPSKYFKQILATVTIASAVAFLLTVYQYQSVTGGWTLLGNLVLSKFRDRSLPPQGGMEQIAYSNIWVHYARSFFYILIPVYSMVVVLRKHSTARFGEWFTKAETQLVWLCVFPVVTHHILLIQWTAVHSYSVVKSSVFLSTIIAILLYKILSNDLVSRPLKCFALVTIVSAMLMSVMKYRGDFSIAKDPDRYFRIGELIRAHVSSKDVVFAVSHWMVEPQIIYYSGRNIEGVADKNEALKWLRKHRRVQGKVFYIDKDYKVTGIVPIKDG